jgi:hypothetical protein
MSHDPSLEVSAGVEPAHDGFADRSVPISPTHRQIPVALMQ